jgi:hypothetical protein
MTPDPNLATMATRQDVLAEIERQFTGSDRTTAFKTLNLFTGTPGGGERERVQLEILGQTGGNLESLRALVDVAKRTPGAVRPAVPLASAPSPPAPLPPSPTGRGPQGSSADAADPHLARVIATAQLQGARHIKGEDAELAVGSSREYPPWRYIFYVAIGIIPVLTLGGAIPLAIAGAGITGCRQFATDVRQPQGVRMIVCLGITIACWVAVFALVGGIALLRPRI